MVFAHHPEIGDCNCAVFWPAAHLQWNPALDDANGRSTGLSNRSKVQPCPAACASPGDPQPLHTSLVPFRASISEDIRPPCKLLVSTTSLTLPHVAHGDQTESASADVRHAEEPLVALLGLAHVQVAFAAGVLGRARRGDQRGINHHPPQQSLVAQQLVDQRQDLLGQFVLLQHMTKRKWLLSSGNRSSQPGRQTPEQGVVQRFFHGRVVSVNHCCMKWMRALHRTADGRVCLRQTAPWAAGPSRIDRRPKIGLRFKPAPRPGGFADLP